LLAYMDHYDNDASMATFAEALHDPEEHVRTAALHGLSCDACKKDDLCVADVVAGLIEVLEHDPVADLRIRSLQQLTYLAAKDDRVAPAIKRCASSDADPVVRRAAADSLAGRFAMPAKRYDRSRVRHAATRSRR
jgi:HEAT repeat protein